MDRSSLVIVAFALTKLKGMAIWQICAAVFLLQHRLLVKYPYPIELTLLGPHCEDLQVDLHRLVSLGELEMPSSEYYRVTNYQNAQKLGEQALDNLEPSQLEDVSRMMSWVSNQPYGSLVTHLYRDYPDFRS